MVFDLLNKQEKQAEKNEKLDWVDEELKTTESEAHFTGERLPALKFETGKITAFSVDTSVPFGVWTGVQSGKERTKAMIPVIHKGERKLLWLNKKNPLYREILVKIKAGITDFKVAASGSQDLTRYNLVEEE